MHHLFLPIFCNPIFEAFNEVEKTKYTPNSFPSKHYFSMISHAIWVHNTEHGAYFGSNLHKIRCKNGSSNLPLFKLILKSFALKAVLKRLCFSYRRNIFVK